MPGVLVEHPKAKRPMLLMEAFKLWRRTHDDRAPGTVKAYRYTLRRFAREGIRRISDATPANVFRWLVEREASKITKSTELAALCSVLGTLEAADLFPFETLRRLRALRGKLCRRGRRKRFAARFLTPEEVERLCSAAARSSRPESELAIRIGVLAGLRAGEIARLRWEDLELAGRHPILRVRKGKTGARTVPVCRELRELLAPLAQRSGYVLAQVVDVARGRGRKPKRPHKSVRTLRRELKVAAEGARLEDMTWHVIRHTRISWWVQAGVSLAKVAKFCGNSPEIIAVHYAGLLDGYDKDCEKRPGARREAKGVSKRLERLPRSRDALRTSTAQGRRARILAGKWQGGSAPYGYRLGQERELVVEPREALVVKLVFAERLRGKSVEAIADELRARGIRTRSGHDFFPTPLRWILDNPVCTGRIRVAGEVLVGCHERIVDEATFAEAQALLAKDAS